MKKPTAAALIVVVSLALGAGAAAGYEIGKRIK